MTKGNSARLRAMERISQFIHVTQNTETFPKQLNSCHLINICRQNCSLFVLLFNQFNVKYQYIHHLLKKEVITLKTFVGNGFHLLQEENQLILPLDKFIVAQFRHFFIMKICNLVTVRYYFGLLKFFSKDGFAIKLFFHSIADFIPNIIMV